MTSTKILFDMFRVSRSSRDSAARAHQRECIITRCARRWPTMWRATSAAGKLDDDHPGRARGVERLSIDLICPKAQTSWPLAVPTNDGEVHDTGRARPVGPAVPRKRCGRSPRSARRATADLLQLGQKANCHRACRGARVERQSAVECLVAGDAYQLKSLDALIETAMRMSPTLWAT